MIKVILPYTIKLTGLENRNNARTVPDKKQTLTKW